MPLTHLAQGASSPATLGCADFAGPSTLACAPNSVVSPAQDSVIPSLPAAGLLAASLGPTKPSQTAPRVLSVLLLLLSASSAHAEYIVLRSGQRLHVTSYQLLGDKYRLQLPGGWLDVPTGDVVNIEPEDVFTPIPPPPAAAANPGPPYTELVAAAASRYGVDPELIASVIAVESNFDPKAVSRRNARGLMQLLPETAARLGVKDIFDPKENIDAGTRYLKELLQLYNNDVALTLAAYNAGPERVQQFGRVPPFAETISYVKRVKRTYEKTKSAPPARPAIPTAPKTTAADPPPSASSKTPPAPPPFPN